MGTWVRVTFTAAARAALGAIAHDAPFAIGAGP